MALSSELNTYYHNKGIESWKVLETLNGWNAYAMQGNTCKLRLKLEAP